MIHYFENLCLLACFLLKTNVIQKNIRTFAK